MNLRRHPLAWEMTRGRAYNGLCGALLIDGRSACNATAVSPGSGERPLRGSCADTRNCTFPTEGKRNRYRRWQLGGDAALGNERRVLARTYQQFRLLDGADSS